MMQEEEGCSTKLADADETALSQGKIYNPFVDREGHKLRWKDIVIKKGNTVIVDRISGVSFPGKLTAVMGPSGSGKTTLLRALGGRSKYSGEIFFDDEMIEPGDYSFQRKIAFVADSEVLEPYATCRESIRFSARLRLPASFSEQSIDRIVSDILSELALDKCAGNQCKWLSAGEKRRTILGIELVTRPSIAILDEPTSGLDSHNAVLLLRCLRRVADSGCSILMSIHHPSQVMFESLNHVLLINGGRAMLQCDVKDVPQYFVDRGAAVPAGENPADWMLEVSQTRSTDELEALGFFVGHPTALDEIPESTEQTECGTDRSALERLCSDLSRKNLNNPGMPEAGNSRTRPSLLFYQMMDDAPASFALQFKLLAMREATRMKRDKPSFLSRLAISAIGGVFLAIVFRGVIDDEINSFVDFTSHVGILFLFLFCGLIVAPSIVLEFLDRRPMFDREFRTGHYGVWSYSMVSSLSELVVCSFQALITFPLAFWAIGFQGRPGYLLLLYVANAYAITNFTVAISCIPQNVKIAEILLGLNMFPMMVWSGFFVALSKLPSWIQWPSWLMPLFYTLRLFASEELRFCGEPRGREKDLLQCLERLEDVFDHDVTFADQSIFTLAQTGVYKGADGILEYTSLFTGNGTPDDGALLYNTCVKEGHGEILVHDVSPTHCDVTIAVVLRGVWSHRVALAPETGHQSAYGYRMKYTPQIEGKRGVQIDEQHLFWANPFQNVYPVFDQSKMSEDVCSTLQTYCDPSHFASFSDHEECVEAMNSLPVSEINDHGVNSYQGNSTTCRRIHAYMAATSPDIHCPHLSWFSEADPSGAYKCDPKYRDQLFYNWTEEELQLFQRVASDSGLPDEALARDVPMENIGECMSDPLPTLITAATSSGEFGSLDFQCYDYLNELDATMENTSLYWGLLVAVSIGYRLVGMFFLRRNAVAPI